MRIFGIIALSLIGPSKMLVGSGNEAFALGAEEVALRDSESHY